MISRGERLKKKKKKKNMLTTFWPKNCFINNKVKNIMTAKILLFFFLLYNIIFFANTLLIEFPLILQFPVKVSAK